jgi:predicted transposase YbfD/YdcC
LSGIFKKKVKQIYWITEEIDGVKTKEVRYHLCSIPQGAAQYAPTSREHRGIENSLHWVLDVVFREDSSRIRKDCGPENMALVRHVFYNLLKTIWIKASF